MIHDITVDAKLLFSFLMNCAMKKYISILLAVLLCINYLRFCSNNVIFIGCIVTTALLFLYGMVPEQKVRNLYITHSIKKRLAINILAHVIVATNMIYFAYFQPIGICVIVSFIGTTIIFLMQQLLSFKLGIIDIIDGVMSENETEITSPEKKDNEL